MFLKKTKIVNRFFIIYVFIITALLLFGVELLSFGILKVKNKNKNFIFQRIINTGGIKEYKVIDPLLGWAISDEDILKKGYNVEFGHIVLATNIVNQKKPLNIYITGGSTSDLILNNHNWPFYLNEILKQNKINAKLFVAAVGGYNSGQELLSIIRDYSNIKPDIHISYSGANDPTSSNYSNYFETSIIDNAIHSNGLFPNIKALFMSENSSNLILKKSEYRNPVMFWKQNQETMNSFAKQNSYSFISILQPVLNFNNRNINPKADLKSTLYFLKENEKIYPCLIEYADTALFINNFTNVFSDFSNKIIFKDDCHLISDFYQNKLAEEIFQLIKSKQKID